MNKQIQVDYDLFRDLVVYALSHEDAGNVLYERIRTGIRRKADAMKRRVAYTAYKTGKDPEFIGLADDFRWPVGQDYNVTRNDPFEQPLWKTMQVQPKKLILLFLTLYYRQPKMTSNCRRIYNDEQPD